MHQSEDIAKARVDGSGFCIGGLFHLAEVHAFYKAHSRGCTKQQHTLCRTIKTALLCIALFRLCTLKSNARWLAGKRNMTLENGPLVRTEVKEGFCAHAHKSTCEHMHIHGSRVILSLRHRKDLLVDKQEESLCTFSTAPQLSASPAMCGYLPAELVSEGFEAGLFDALKDHKPSCLYFVIIRINIQAWQEWKMRWHALEARPMTE